MRDVRAGTVKRIVCTELSRLGRKLGNLVLVLDELHALGCEVVIVREGIDYTTPAGRMFAQILGALAEFERERIGERIRSGVLRAKEKGTRSGKLIGGQLREFDLQRAIELRTNGASWRTIAQAVGCPTVTVRRRVQAHWDEFRGVPRTTPQKEADSA
jgi:DNA invertase Pin-like site-specific DNA recombinase